MIMGYKERRETIQNKKQDWLVRNPGKTPPWIVEFMAEAKAESALELPLPPMRFVEYWMYYPQRPSRKEMDLFWERAKKSGECLIWMGALKSTSGLPIYSWDKFTNRSARRAAWLYHRGMPLWAWPVGKRCVSLCGNPLCVEPTHLAIGTTKGRGAKLGEAGRWSKLINPLNDSLTFQTLWEAAEAAMAAGPEAIREYASRMLKA